VEYPLRASVAHSNATEQDWTIPFDGKQTCEGEKDAGRNLLSLQVVAAIRDRLIPAGARAGDGARTHDSHVGNVENPLPKPLMPQGIYGELPSSVAHQLPTAAEIDPDLKCVIDAWSKLSQPLKAAVLALVQTAR
jgi:hypothetical protein